MEDSSSCETNFSLFNQELSCININSHTTFSSKNSASISITFDAEGMRLEFPKYKASYQTYSMLLTKSDVIQVFVYCDKYSCTFVSVTTSAKLVEEFEKNLKTFKVQSPYYNPDIESAKHLKISFLLQNISEDILRFFCIVYGEDKVKSIQPRDAYTLLKSSSVKCTKSSRPLISRSLVYPSVGGIQVRCEDIAQLAHGRPLNDTIIEFYLKYIYHEKIDEQNQLKTHVFSTFFYECLQRALKKTTELKTFERVYTWTKNVDLFSKDFIFIPINKRQHWYLAVICFLPRLCKEPKEETILNDDSANSEETSGEKLSKTSSELPSVETKSNSRKTRQQEVNQIDRNKPCICFFDSSDDSVRLSKEKCDVAKMLKEFLKILWENKNPDKPCKWDKLLFLKAQCPQQRNKYDCGIFLLQYVESFFETPISCFQEPLPDLRNWFTPLSVKTKRTKIRNLISELKEKQKEMPHLSENQEELNSTTSSVECISQILEQSDLHIENSHCIDDMEIVD